MKTNFKTWFKRWAAGILLALAWWLGFDSLLRHADSSPAADDQASPFHDAARQTALQVEELSPFGTTGSFFDDVPPAPTAPTNELLAAAEVGSGPENDKMLENSARGGGASRIAVVDVERLLAAHPPLDDMPEARGEALRKIRRMIDASAVHLPYDIVLDGSGTSASGANVVLSFPGARDITAELEAALVQQSSITGP